MTAIPEPVRLHAPVTPARVVLDAHVQLQERLRDPSADMITYHRGFMADALSKDAVRAAGMFFPLNTARPGGVDHALAVKLCRLMAEDLRRSRTYQVTAEMMHALAQVTAQTSDGNRIDHLEEAELPCAEGFCWFDVPWMIRTKNSKSIPIRAVSWAYTTAKVEGPIEGAVEPDEGWKKLYTSGKDYPCVRICAWESIEDEIAAGLVPDEDPFGGRTVKPAKRRDDMAAEATGQEYIDYFRRLGGLTLMHIMVVPFQLRFDPTTRMVEETEARLIADGSTVPVHPDSALHLTHLLWMFLTMEITALHRPQIERASRRRAQKSLMQGEVSVVILRRAVHDPDTPGWHHTVDWSCRWPVQGHHRHLDGYTVSKHRAIAVNRDKSTFCAVCGVELTWVRPYLKGPDGKPLRFTRGTIERLAR